VRPLTDFLTIKRIVRSLLDGKVPVDKLDSLVEAIAIHWHNDVSETYEEAFQKGFSNGFGF
jgi:hypothetical protein